MPKPSVERLREVLAYDAATGLLTWRITLSNAAVHGKPAGTRDERYVRVSVDKCKMLAHRVIWAIVTGCWPELDVDHEDGDGHNNRWLNLRDASESQNGGNSKIPKRNTVGLKGVTRHKERFRAQITINYRNHYIGTFDTPEQAHEAYMARARHAFGKFARAK